MFIWRILDLNRTESRNQNTMLYSAYHIKHAPNTPPSTQPRTGSLLSPSSHIPSLRIPLPTNSLSSSTVSHNSFRIQPILQHANPKMFQNSGNPKSWKRRIYSDGTSDRLWIEREEDLRKIGILGGFEQSSERFRWTSRCRAEDVELQKALQKTWESHLVTPYSTCFILFVFQ